MGKRRKGSNKKRDAAMAGLKDAVSDEETGLGDDDPVYGEVDQWEREEEKSVLSKVKLRGERSERRGPEEMFALSGTDSDSDLELPTMKKLRKKAKSEKSQDEPEINDSDVEDNTEEEYDIRRWGKRKKNYYGGNTGEEMEEGIDESDLEEDRMEEIEAGKLQSRQLEMLEEEDFLDTYVAKKNDKVAPDDSKTVSVDSIIQDFSKMTPKEQKSLFKQQNPEFEGVMSDFRVRMDESIKLSRILTLADQGNIPDGPCLEFVKYKLELLLNYCTNISAYIMFKSKGVSLTLHPVTTRLVQYRQLLDKVESVEQEAMSQINALVTRLDNGENILTVVKEERIKAKRMLNKEQAQKKLKQSKKKTKKNKKKDKLNETEEKVEDLTRDELMALEVFDAMKKKKTTKEKEEVEDGSSSEDEEPAGDDDEELDDKQSNSLPQNTYNNVNEDLEDDDIDEKRAITYKIAKNKGLTPKRSKLQRNPRVKNKMKYIKALKKRKGAVRDIRDQNSKYGGESSGINMRVKKGVKFN